LPFSPNALLGCSAGTFCARSHLASHGHLQPHAPALGPPRSQRSPSRGPIHPCLHLSPPPSGAGRLPEPTEIIDAANCKLLVPVQVWKYVFIPNMGHDVRFVFFKPRNQSDYKLWIPYGIGDNTDSMSELVSGDAIGTDIDPRRAVQYVFGPVNPYTTMTNLEMTCKDGDELLKAIYQTTMNKTDVMKVFNPPEVNEEDVHKILRSVVLADPNALHEPECPAQPIDCLAHIRVDEDGHNGGLRD